MKKKLCAFLLLVTFMAGVVQPSSTNAAEMYPKITSIQPVNFVSLSE